jgi:hypothetical protein
MAAEAESQHDPQLSTHRKWQTRAPGGSRCPEK